MTEDQNLTGAQFRRDAGTDPEQWAKRFLAAYATALPDELRTYEDRQAFVAGWFRDFAEVVAKDRQPGFG